MSCSLRKIELQKVAFLKVLGPGYEVGSAHLSLMIHSWKQI
uniref:Uncharacterized protein n=1 Tax=Anguilla anguilla TaxID=7936 RepID=A0A0E9R6D8_ANGAN